MKEEEIEKLTADYQSLVEQLQTLSAQKEHFSMQKEEQNEALKELELAKGKIYMALGGVLIEASKDEAIKKLKEKQDSVEMRLSLISRQHEELSKKEKEMREKINEAIHEKV
ncbi:MAG: prefoldin subunit [Candidatus Marsarchaeota archaeon]|jgi:prefoldin beta subunit|nr:prefoldin subunit [Candidatus Marsarchaeota archaeon]